MPHKKILFRSAAREKIPAGPIQWADAVRVTLGPRSRSVLIERKWGALLVCNDGVMIAREFDLKHPEENLGAWMLLEAAQKTDDMVPHDRRNRCNAGTKPLPLLSSILADTFSVFAIPKCPFRTDRW